MKKMYKAMLLALCAVLLVAGSVMGTLAYLQDKTETVTNTFAVGKVEITLHEYQLDEAGKKVPETNDQGEVLKDSADNIIYKKAENNLTGIKLVPDREIQKNPVITVKEGSEACYLFVKVEDGLKALATINWDLNKWKPLSNGIYYYYQTVAAPTDNDPNAVGDVEVPVFPSITCKNVEMYENAENISLAITAYAVQAEGFDSASAAWSAANFS